MKISWSMQPFYLPVIGPLVLYLGFLSVLWMNDPAMAAENGLMENLQAASLGFCFLCGLTGLLKGKGFERRFFFAALALLFLGFFLREVDVEKLDVPEFLVLLGSGWGRTVLLLCPSLVLVVLLAFKRRVLCPAFFDFFKAPVPILLLVGTTLYATGYVFDHHLLGLSKGLDQFFEELWENGATYFYVSASLFLLRINLIAG